LQIFYLLINANEVSILAGIVSQLIILEFYFCHYVTIFLYVSKDWSEFIDRHWQMMSVWKTREMLEEQLLVTCLAQVCHRQLECC